VDAEAYKKLQNLHKGLSTHATWIMKRRTEPRYEELNELMFKTIGA